VEIPALNVTYHSVYGAIQESKHVFIEAGLKNVALPADTERLNIFEAGFGTGLNALLTIIEAEKLQREVLYETVERFPLNSFEIKSLNYCKQLDSEDLQPVFEQLHNCEWEKEINITSHFIFKKTKSDLLHFQAINNFRLIYFDAFAPTAQPELWTKEVFEKMFFILDPGGILVTYCSKGDVRRTMQAAGFTIEKLPGPPGKREMIRATR
jgi:tRNA U34 5-methylaminomethyl-2-thiouridine-forming methyltransferase MnmC